MTREELLELVNGKVDTTKFGSLSQKTINEELDDVLEDFGDDEDANDRIVTKLANRLKRMDGNLHKNVSSEIKKAKEGAERKKKEEEEARKRAEQHKDETDDDEKKLYKTLLDKIESLEKANAERDKKAARNATIESVKSGLKDKFDKAGLEMKSYFLKAAISKLEIPDEDVDIDDLVSKAEKIYTAEYKEATGEKGVPKKGQHFTGGGDDDEDKFIEKIAERRKKKYESGAERKK